MRPGHITGRPPLYTAEQVREWRAEYELRCKVLRETRSVARLAKDAGCAKNSMDMILAGQTYQWVR